jgi:nicotinamidase-related amidase
MDPATTALVLLGFQRDFFAADGVLHEVIDDVGDEVLTRTLALLTGLAGSPVLLVSTPIVFTPSYEELVDPVGVLRLIQERRAFQSGEPGAETLPELAPFEHAIVELPGKRGLDAFTDTELDALLRSRGVNDVVLAGAVTSICIDSTARAAHARGYRVSVLSDCCASRSAFEHGFFFEEIFPLYAEPLESDVLLSRLAASTARTA